MSTEQLKTCSLCMETKPVSEFHPQRHGRYGVTGRCRKCRNAANKKYLTERPGYAGRKYRRNPEAYIRSSTDAQNQIVQIAGLPFTKRKISKAKALYGLTVEQLEVLFSAKSCACCDLPFAGVALREIHVDHDHVTGSVRGLLCKHCNWLLGHAKDDPAILEKAVRYLRRSSHLEETV